MYSLLPRHDSLKTLCAVLMILLVAHLQCSGSCLSESFKSHVIPDSDKPPCHQHEDTPSNPSPQKSHETDSPCSQGQVIESKGGLIAKHVLLFNAVLPVVISDLDPTRACVHTLR